MAESFSTGLVNGMLHTNCFKTLMANGVLVIFGGTKPTNADATEGSSPLMIYTLNGGAFTGGVSTNGLNFDTAVDGVISKVGADVWKGTGLAAAGTGTTATWYRFYANAYVTGASTTAVRFDGSIGTSSSYELKMSNTTIVEGVEATVSTFSQTLPKA